MLDKMACCPNLPCKQLQGQGPGFLLILATHISRFHLFALSFRLYYNGLFAYHPMQLTSVNQGI